MVCVALGLGFNFETDAGAGAHRVERKGRKGLPTTGVERVAKRWKHADCA